MLKINHYVKNTKLLGPGERFVIWVQGCQKRCAGCINPQGQPLDGGHEISVADLVQKIKEQPNLTGVTISGGEPFLQEKALANIVRKIREETTLDIMLYTGYSYQEVTKYEEILQYVDVLVDGEYEEDLNDDSLYRGSSNQKIYFLSEKYRPYQAKIENSKSRHITFEIDSDGEVFMVGIPPQGFYEKFMEKIMGES